MTREYTRHLLNLIDEGVLDRSTVITACLNYMSEAEVKDMCHSNDFFTLEKDEDVEDGDYDPFDDFNYVGSRHHY